jgi:tetratricopeptide (TPR) repeat protein
MLQANAYLGSNQVMKAAQNYEIVDRLGKPTIETLNMCGDIYVNEGLYADAVRCYSRAMEMTPRGPAERGIRACRVLIARQANDEAESLISAMKRIYGADLSANERKDLNKLRSRLAVAKGAGEEEAKILAEIVALDPMDGEALILLGQYHQRTGDPDRAVFNYEAAAKIEKFEADAKVRHAQLLVSQGKYAEALPLLRAAQQVKPRENIQSYLDQVERVAKQRGAAAGSGS